MAKKRYFYIKKKGVKNWYWVVVAFLILGVAAIQFGVVPMPNWPMAQPNEQPQGQVNVVLKVQDAATLDVVTGATVYAKRADGTIEAFSESSTSPGKYTLDGINIGEQLLILVSKTGYYSAVTTITAGEPNSATGEYSAGSVQIYKISTSVAISATIGANAITTEINRTTLGISEGGQFTMTLIISNNDQYSAFGNSYENFKTKKTYVGPLFVVKIDPTKVTIASVSGATLYDSFSIGTDQYYVYTFDQLVNNPDDSDAKSSVSIQITFNHIADGADVINFYTYGEVNADYISAANFGTAAASLAGLDIVT